MNLHKLNQPKGRQDKDRRGEGREGWGGDRQRKRKGIEGRERGGSGRERGDVRRGGKSVKWSK